VRDLIVVTAGGFGREVEAYARQSGWNVLGFLHDEHRYPGSLDGLGLRDRIVGPVEGHRVRADAAYAIGLGDVAPRREVADRLLAEGAQLATVVHPSAWVADSASLGAGVVVAPFAYVGPDARVGDLSLLNTYASVGHDSVVGRCCALAPYAVANGRVVLEDEVFLATHAVVTPRRTVGRNSVVSAGSVVLRDVAPGSLAAGNPARARQVYRVEPERR
jgi:sugar O-acyltransferase (sialic acid O-acetyltransferase NeuD family)